MKIKCIELSKHFLLPKKKKALVLKNINLNIHSGDIIGLVGKNGAGKTTLLKILAKRMPADSGKIIHEDNDFDTLISYVSSGDRSFFWNLTVKSNFDFFVTKLNKKLVEKLEIKHLMNRKFSSLSSGEKKKLIVSKSILNGNKVLILDEFTSSLDLTTKYQIYKLLKKLVKDKIVDAIIFATHDINEILSLSNKCILLNDGVISDKLNITKETTDIEIKNLMLK